MAYELIEVDILNVVRGDSFDLSFFIASDFYEITQETSILAHVKQYIDSIEPTLTFSSKNASIQVDGQYIRLRKTSIEMEDIAVGRYNYDIQFTSPDEGVNTLIGGKFQIKQDYTK